MQQHQVSSTANLRSFTGLRHHKHVMTFLQVFVFLIYYLSWAAFRVQGWPIGLTLDVFEPVTECWEECFHEGNVDDREAYMDFFKLTNLAKMHRIMDNMNGTAFILDSSLVKRPDLDLFRYQKDLIKLMAMMMPVGRDANPFYLSQFNQDFAW